MVPCVVLKARDGDQVLFFFFFFGFVFLDQPLLRKQKLRGVKGAVDNLTANDAELNVIIQSNYV